MEREKAEPSLQMQGNQVTLILTLGRVWMRGSTVDRDLRMLSGEACRDQLRRGRGRQDWTEGHLAMGRHLGDLSGSQQEAMMLRGGPSGCPIPEGQAGFCP